MRTMLRLCRPRHWSPCLRTDLDLSSRRDVSRRADLAARRGHLYRLRRPRVALGDLGAASVSTRQAPGPGSASSALSPRLLVSPRLTPRTARRGYDAQPTAGYTEPGHAAANGRARFFPLGFGSVRGGDQGACQWTAEAAHASACARTRTPRRDGAGRRPCWRWQVRSRTSVVSEDAALIPADRPAPPRHRRSRRGVPPPACAR